MSIEFPNIDPVLFEIGPLVIRWYALSYVTGIFLGWIYIIKLNKYEPKILTQKAVDDSLVWVTLGIILGGRFGYVLFYNAPYYLSEPGAILKVWQGGMSFHGGLLGLLAAVYILCRREKLNFMAVMDGVACVATIGIFFGRLANFINGELYGRVTDVPWGIVFPSGGVLPRHPSQLYEAGLEGVALFVILALLAVFTKIRHYPGALGGIFLVGYALSRMFIENFREPDAHIGFIIGEFTMGQLLSFPMLLLGVAIVVWSRRVRYDGIK